MTRLIDWLSRSCASLDLSIEIGFTLVLPEQKKLNAIARISSLGAVNGMLIFAGYDEVRCFVCDLTQEGFGYTVLDEPRENEEFDLGSFREMFIEWGWSGDVSSKPRWIV